MKSQNLYSALYCIQSQISDRCSPLCQSTSICNVRTRAKQRYSDISAIKRDIIHNARALWAPSHTQSLVPGSPLISMNIVRGLSSHCARHKCLDFLSARRHSEECCFSREWETSQSQSQQIGEKNEALNDFASRETFDSLARSELCVVQSRLVNEICVN